MLERFCALVAFWQLRKFGVFHVLLPSSHDSYT
jgi:hypothetical protein